MRRTSFLFASAAVLSLALAPGLAHARAGSGSSSGSRGSMTHSAPPTTNTAPTAAQPMQRTVTPSSPAASPAAGMAAPARSSGLMAGLAGGLLGVGLAGMFMGHGFFGGGMGGIGMLGMLLQIGLLGLAVWFVVRLIRSRQQPALATGPGMMARGMDGTQNPMNRMGGSACGPPPVAPLNIEAADFTTFERLLQAVQGAWSNQDEGALRGMTTPEMASYFGEQLMEQRHRGHINTITDVRLESGDLSQAWAENGSEYATVAMRFSMLDVTRDQTGRVVSGDAAVRDVATELWTFIRPTGGRWVLSAIQQTR